MTDNTIEEIKTRLDIKEIIQEYIQLKKAGSNLKAVCPFHGEKTPSFMVSPEKQIWHCFGCGEGGDIFGFIQKIEGVEFPEALRILAKRAGVEVTRQDPQLQNKKTRLLDAVKLTASYYHKVLLDSSQAEYARKYLEERDIDQDAIDRFKIGYSPDSWDSLSDFLKKKGFSEEEVFLAGLTVKKDKGVGYYDRFRGRLMFPIYDVHGNTVGFGGRILQQKEEGAKYINSPQTLIYDKSNVLYGLDKSKTSIRKLGEVIIVEGYTDCISAYQADITNVVASSGTALTEGQVLLLKRFTENLVMSFDQDTAGAEAAKRGIEVALANEMNVKVVELPSGKDPDECIRNSKDEFIGAVKNAKPYLEFYFDNTFQELDTSKVQDKKKAAAILLPVIAKIGDTIEQAHWLKELSKKLDVEENILRDRLPNKTKPNRTNRKTVSGEQKVKVIDRFAKIGEELLSLIIHFPDFISTSIDKLLPEYFTDEKQKELYKNIVVYYTKKEHFDVSNFQKTINTEEQNENNLSAYLDILFLLGAEEFEKLNDNQVKQYTTERINILKKNNILAQLKNIEQNIKALEQGEPSDQNQNELDQLSETFNQLTNQLRNLE
ncbi:DNA primase [Patescibacteria group bacterium]|nr:DNA primase [Patescibacteria group bacterium]MBU1951590.1 DNA primase [Patescibacteria group bacterium]